jgi:uncharacterized protein
METNVYVSALNFGGIPDEVLEFARRGQIELFVSTPIVEEIAGVLIRKFHWPANRTHEAIAVIRQFAQGIEPKEKLSVIRADEPDNRVLECALAANATIIASGDSRLRDLGSFEGIRILSPRTFLDAVKGPRTLAES